MRLERVFPALFAVTLLLGVAVSPAASQPSDPDGGVSSPAPAPAVRMDVRAGFDGAGRLGGWIPLDVELVNEGPEVRADVQVTVGQPGARGTPAAVPTVFSLPVVLPRLSHKRFTMEVNLPNVSNARVTAKLVNQQGGGETLTEQEVTMTKVPLGDYFCGVLARDPSAYDFLASLELPPPIRRARTTALEPATVPERAQLMGSFDCIIIDNAATSQLRSEQLAALQVWVGTGGLLLVVGGPTWQSTLSSLPPDLLPVEPTGLTQVQSLSSIADALDLADAGTSAAAGPWLVTQSRPRLDRGARVIAAEDGVPLIVAAKRGEGTTIFLAFEPTGWSLRGWTGAEPLWRYLMTHAAVDNGVGSSLVRPYLRWGATPRVGMADFSTHPKNSLDWLWKLVAVYGLAVTTALFVTGRRGLVGLGVGITVGLSIGTTGLGLALARQNADADAAVTRLSIVRPIEVGDSSTAYTHDYVSILAKQDGEYDFVLPEDSLARGLFYPAPRPPDESDKEWTFRVGLGTSETLDKLSLKQGQLATAVLDGQLRQAPGVQADLRVENGALSGTLVNRTGGKLTDSFLAVDNQFTPLGTLDPDQVRQIDVNLPRQAAAGYVTAQQVASQLTPGDAASRPGGAARRNLVESLFFDRFVFRRMELRGPTLVGWLEVAPNAIQAPSIKLSNADFVLLVQPLQPRLPLGWEGDVPASAMNRRDLGVNSSTSNDQPFYAVSPGESLMLQFALPQAEGQFRLNQLRVNLEGQYNGRSSRLSPLPFTISLYNWRAAEWQAWEVFPGSSIIPDGARYVSAVGEIRLRYTMEINPSNGAAPREARFQRLDVTPSGVVR